MTIRLYHGSQDEIVEPQYGLGQDRHDFGRGFYLTEVPGLHDLDMRLAVEKVAAEVGDTTTH